jgi:transposase
LPAPVRVTLTAAARTDLVERFNATRDAEARLRYQMVLLAGDGRTAPQIAPLVQRHPATVWRVLTRYLAGGAAGLASRPRPGRPRVAPPRWDAELRRVIELDPHAVGVASANWTTGLLAAYLAARTGHRTSDEAVRLALHRAEYVCKRSGWTLKRKAQEQPGWAGNG